MTLRDRFEAEYCRLHPDKPIDLRHSQIDKNTYCAEVTQAAWEGYQLAIRTSPVDWIETLIEEFQCKIEDRKHYGRQDTAPYQELVDELRALLAQQDEVKSNE